MYPGIGAKIAGVVGQVGLSAASKIMCYLLVMFLECWQAKVRHEQGVVECASRSQFGRNLLMFSMKCPLCPLYPPPLNYYTKKNALSSFAEAVAADRRPASATGSGTARCLHDRHYTTLL